MNGKGRASLITVLYLFYLFISPTQINHRARNTQVQKPCIPENYPQNHGGFSLLLKPPASSHPVSWWWMSPPLPGPTLAPCSPRLWKMSCAWRVAWQGPAEFPCSASTWCSPSRSVCCPSRYAPGCAAAQGKKKKL